MLSASYLSPFFPVCPQLGVHLALAKIQLTRVLTIAPYYMLSNQTKVCSDYIHTVHMGVCVRVEGELRWEWLHLALIDCECHLNHKHKHAHEDTQTCTHMICIVGSLLHCDNWRTDLDEHIRICSRFNQ